MGFFCKDFVRLKSTNFRKLCYSMHTMSEIYRGMPEGVKPTATVINFEAAKGKRLEEKNRQAQWIQERTQKQPLSGVDAAIPVSSQLPTESIHTPKRENKDEFPKNDGETGENRNPADFKNTVIDFQKARENRLINQQENSPVNSENTKDIPSFLKPRPIDAGENFLNDSPINRDNQTDELDREKDEEQQENDIDSEQETR